MVKKLYPADQVQNYLLIDVIAIVFLMYKIIVIEGQLGLFVQLLLAGIVLISFYFCLWHRDWLLPIASLAGCTALMILAIYVDQWVLLYGFIFADLIGRARSKIYIGIGIIGITAMHFGFSWIDNSSLSGIIKTTIFPIMIIQMIIPIVIFIKEKTKILQRKLDTANAQLILEEERHRIARDLHDTLGQTLTMIKLKSELTMRLIDKDSNRAKEEIEDILNTSRAALKQVRELVSDMQFISLEKELDQLKSFLYTAGIEMINKEQEPDPVLSHVTETMLALCIREAITNIIRHSEAKKCMINRFKRDEMYQIEVIDDGNGHIKEGKGNGIRSIKERMEMLQGEAEIMGNPAHGTTIILKVPIQVNGGKHGE
ncbi:sensor histidine kinase [Metabacillus fastidiosus]|uniref:histidine kinase n=1 Tax=Metabacillus fastidiosus TaxID=1458 RepID=A0ABU6P1G8_9BACI|nr:sensor histidine kinase [Metabacillus fastidiosus]MED4403204.1 sensor histidine kinase [Metabacillus fastidiosus]MED4461628.1 sensor histidine kinase [Metabacillus fastidiosus]